MPTAINERWRLTFAALRASLAAPLFAAMFAGTAIAGPLEDAVAAYERGDYATEMRLMRPLAEQGNAVAQSYIGSLYVFGRGVPQNYAEALKWFRLAADQGESLAQHNLGSMYQNGLGVPQNYAEAVKWYRKAANQGNADAQTNLGTMYATGQGVPQDYVEAHKWFNLAASSDPTPAQNRDNTAIKNRALAERRMTPAQIAEAQKLAREWKPK